MRPSTLVFDYDGTLHDSMYVYADAFPAGYQTLVDAGKARPRTFAREELERNLGLNVFEAWARLAPEIPWEVAEPAALHVKDVMLQAVAAGKARLYDGVPQMLDAVKAAGHTLVFLSNCATEYQEAARKAFDLDQWFSGYYNAQQFDYAPKEEIFKSIERDFEGPFIAIGDRHKDIALSAAHRLPCIGCLYGFGTPEELADATELAHAPADIPALVARIEAARA
ncbi:hypothetical protein AAY81_08455 [Denitrobacterium detoxificans]|uniref:Phosphoglycolate phosphatase n=1 Tax=Denitrobacterium detoxificans TaxID=79604 RepID=A0A172RZM9_9ACTN|nr:HAD family hydrolase [Denitrobacterium detoxificans]ANE23134.1 hypothetical protein AAY81_08455 [Denitrobacterium detoxificans]SEO54237.1 phosphoglycolate phosphatase [Denitrobacterium detoxificans]